MVRNRKTSSVKLLFVFNASHSIGDVDQATMLLDAAIRVQCQSRRFDWTKRRGDVAISRWTCNHALETFESL